MAERAVVLFPGSLGDFLCALPALRAIGRLSPQGVEVIGRKGLFEIAQQLPFIRKTVSIDAGYFASLFTFHTTVKSEVFSFFSSASHIFSWFGHTHPEVRANLEKIAPGRVRSFDFFVGQEDRHASAYYLRCIGVQEIRCPSLTLGKKEKQWLDHYGVACGWDASSKVLVIQPGSGGRKKRWEVDGFRAVTHWWREKPQHQVLILLGPAEEQEEALWQQCGKVEKNLSLLQVAALLSRASVYLGNDSGISHLAGSVGARGVVLFGPTCPRHWRPLGGALSVLQNVHYRAKMPHVSGISLSEISAEEVIAALRRAEGGS
jgi:heptosyltransferase-3